jgi:hypothetical protein
MTLDERAATMKREDVVALLAAHDELSASNEELAGENEGLRRQLDWFKRQLFGEKSEPGGQRDPTSEGVCPTYPLRPQRPIRTPSVNAQGDRASILGGKEALIASYPPGQGGGPRCFLSALHGGVRRDPSPSVHPVLRC